jgi:hypothetical protein
LFYADDLVLVANSICELQALLDQLQVWSDSFHLAVNVAKTECLFLGTRPSPSDPVPSVQYKGRNIKVVSEFKYLGLTVSRNYGFKSASHALQQSASKATFALLSKCKSMNITSAILMFRLFDALVEPILTYGSEVWVSYELGKLDLKHLLDDSFEHPHLTFLRSVFRVGRNVPRQNLYMETNRWPMVLRCVAAILRYFNYLLSLPSDRVVKRAFLADLQLSRFASSWSSELLDFLSVYHRPSFERIHAALRSGDFQSCESIPVQCVLDSVYAALRSEMWMVQDGSHRHTYLSLFAPVLGQSAPYLTDQLHACDMRLLTGFRLGQHCLSSAASCRGGVSDSCPFCLDGVLESERHFVFACPAYASVRQKFAYLGLDFTLSCDRFFALSDQLLLARFLSAMFACRQRFLKRR